MLAEETNKMLGFMKSVLVFILNLTLTESFCQTDRQKVRAAAEILTTAAVKSNWQTLIDLTHPKLVETAGGRENMISVLVYEMEQMGMRFTDILRLRSD